MLLLDGAGVIFGWQSQRYHCVWSQPGSPVLPIIGGLIPASLHPPRWCQAFGNLAYLVRSLPQGLFQPAVAVSSESKALVGWWEAEDMSIRVQAADKYEVKRLLAEACMQFFVGNAMAPFDVSDDSRGSAIMWWVRSLIEKQSTTHSATKSHSGTVFFHSFYHYFSNLHTFSIQDHLAYLTFLLSSLSHWVSVPRFVPNIFPPLPMFFMKSLIHKLEMFKQNFNFLSLNAHGQWPS